CQHHKSYPYSF
nr:immunoglobulin light chain junction region [Macaca mulatta]MOW61939.1 immunoglobulin light chain junction region [Macaca mulatta]MOW64654.1 immunoglobulin light chain junction region [Macaca mulatta]